MQEKQEPLKPNPGEDVPGEDRTSEEVAAGGTDSGVEATVPEDESGASSGAGEVKRNNSSPDTTPASKDSGTGRIPGGAKLSPNPGRSGAES